MGPGARDPRTLLARLRGVFGALLARARTPTTVALFSYAVLAVAFTWPVVLRLGERIAGKKGDLRIALWDFWWLETAIREGRSPFHTPYLFYPDGVSLAYHSVSWLVAAVALPLRALFGPIAGYNLAFLFEAFACATTTFFLARYLAKDGLSAWIAGAIVAFEPFRMTRAMHHPNLASTAFVALVFLWSLRALRERRRRFAWLAGLALALVLLTGAHLFILTTLALGPVVVLEALRARALRDRAFWKVLAVLGFACLLFTGPFVWGYAGSSDALDEAIASVSQGGSTDLASLFIVSPEQTLFGDAVRPRFRLYGESGSIAYVGTVTLVLVAAAFCAREHRREAGRFALVAFAFLVFALGPTLEVAGRRTGIALPYAWIDQFRFVQAIRAPERFNLVARLFIALVAALGCASLRQALGSRARLAWVLVPLLLLDYLAVPHPTVSFRESRFYRELARRGGGGAVLELPLTRENGKRAMLSQTTHHRPIVGGMVARTPVAAMRYVRRSRLLRSLEGRRPARLDCARVPLRRELERLRRDGVEYVVYRPNEATRAQRRAYEDVLVGKPSYADAALRVYGVADLLARESLPCDVPASVR